MDGALSMVFLPRPTPERPVAVTFPFWRWRVCARSHALVRTWFCLSWIPSMGLRPDNDDAAAR